MISPCNGALCNAPDHIFWIICSIGAGLAILSVVVSGNLFIRLEIYHNMLWKKLGSPGFMMKPGVPGNLTSPFRVTYFLWTERVSRHDDPVLTSQVWGLRVIGAVADGMLIYGYYVTSQVS